MEYSYDDLSKKTVAELRELASGIEDERIRGYSQLPKHELLPRLCMVLGIDMHAHHRAVGEQKSKIKAEIRALKQARDAAVQAKDYRQLREIRQKIHKLKHELRKAMV